MEATAVPFPPSPVKMINTAAPPPVANSPGDTERRERRTTELLTQARDPSLAEPERKRLQDLAVRVNIPVADSLARRYRSRGEDLDDLIQVARMGLVQAVRRFDPDSGAFLAFAVPTITGEIKRHFRDHCWTVRPPRRLQELHGAVNAAWSELAQQQAGTPSVDQIADWLDADRDDVLEAMRSNAFTSASLESGDNARSALDVLGAPDPQFDEVEDDAERQQLIGEVRRACAHLSQEERDVLRMRFEEGRSQSSIAEELGVSQMSVSRRLRKITSNLRSDIVHHRHHPPPARMTRSRSMSVTRPQPRR